MLDRFTNRFAPTAFLLFFVFSSSFLDAQSASEEPSPENSPQELEKADQIQKPLEFPDIHDVFSKGFARSLVRDQKAIWTSPARIKPSDAKWLLPLAGGTAFLFTKDNQIADHFKNDTSLKDASSTVGKVGLYPAWAVPGAFLALGKITHSDRMSDTGVKGFQAAIYTTAVMQTVKLITDRKRPGDGGNGQFWNGGNAFPSGHAMSAWALAKVVSDEYSEKPFVKIGMYSFATAVSLSRISAQRHYASDVLVGSAVGYMIGKFVMRNHNRNQFSEGFSK